MLQFRPANILLTAALALVMAIAAGAQTPTGRIQHARPALVRPQVKDNHSALRVARLHYPGGGDWYWGNSSVPNFVDYIRDNSNFPVDTIEYQVQISDPDLFRYPFLFATGHGTMKFSSEERERLRQYLNGGGFLFINDSYGMEKSVKKEISELFPERELVELPHDHPIYHCFYDFPNGPPKIHEHDGKPPRGYAVIINGRAVLYFLVESDIGDGWEDQAVHNDPQKLREAAFRMGLNILTYATLY